MQNSHKNCQIHAGDFQNIIFILVLKTKCITSVSFYIRWRRLFKSKMDACQPDATSIKKKMRRRGACIGAKKQKGHTVRNQDSPRASIGPTKNPNGKRKNDCDSTDTARPSPPMRSTPRQQQQSKNALSKAVGDFCKTATDSETKSILCEAIMLHLLSFDATVAQQSWEQAIKKYRNETSSTTGIWPAASAEIPSTAPIQVSTTAPAEIRGAPALNVDVFLLGKNGKTLSTNGAKTALQRQKTRLKDAILSTGSFNQQVVALQATLNHPDVVNVASQAGFITAQKDKVALDHMHYLFNNIRTMVQFAMRTEKQNGRPNDDKSAFVENITMALVQPEGEAKNINAPSHNKIASLIGLTSSTGQR